MILKGRDKLRAGNTAALRATCTHSPGKSPKQRGQLPAAKTFVVVKGPWRKTERLKSGRTDIKRILALPSDFHSVHITSR